MVRFQVGVSAGSVPEATKMKPELKPPSIWSQGFVKLDWATVWFPGVPEKLKVMMEPAVALMEGGSKINWVVVELTEDPT